MSQLATITSKRQITIPIKVFNELNLKEGQRLVVSREQSTLKFQSASSIVEKLSGSIKIPFRFRGLSPDKIIKKAKKEYFSKNDLR